MIHRSHLLPNKMGGVRPQNHYTTLFDKKIQETIRPAKASPFGSNGDDRRQWRKQGGAVGAAASRMRAAAKQTLGAATRAVALRSNDGEGKPGTKEPQAQRWAGFLSERYYRCVRAVCQQPSPLSLVALLLASSPKGGAFDGEVIPQPFP